jgi:putative ABC transport system permease protein
MFYNYFIIAIRNLKKRKLYSFINIFGLAIGVAVCLVILKYVDFELSYDSFHRDASNIYRTTTTDYQNGELRGTNPISGYKQGPSLVMDIPEVKTYVRTHPMYGGAVVNNNDLPEPIRFHESNLQFVDSTFLDVFTYTLSSGNLATALDRSNTMVITQPMAEKYFGKNIDPVGKVLTLSGGWSEGDYEVTGVIKDVPQNSHFTFDFLLNMHSLLQNNQYKSDDGWGWNNFVTYVQLHPTANLKAVHDKMPAFIKKYRGEDLAKSDSKQELTLQPIRDIHLHPGLNHESSATTSVNTIYFFILISIFILAIAWVNYINLATARAMERAREVGVKKSVGAYKSQLIAQFFFESVIVNLIGVVLAVFLAMTLLPFLNSIVEKDFAFDFTDPRLWFMLVGLFLVGSFVSGAYPAFVLSSFNPATVLKGSMEKVVSGLSLRKALVVFQFASSLFLIAGTFAVYRQMIFLKNQDKGFNMEQMLIISGPTVIEGKEEKEYDERILSFMNEVRNISSVRQVASSNSVPGAGYNWGTGIRKFGTDASENQSGSIVWVDPTFIETYELEFVSGKKWNVDSKTDMDGVLINETAIKSFGLGDAENALHERLLLGGGDTVSIIGVLKNYNWNSLKTAHVPFLLAPAKAARRHFSVRLEGSTLQNSIEQVEKQFKASFPGNPFNYFFLDDFFDKQYKTDQQFGKIFSLFAILAIIIACLGLWGLASFTTTQKLKEISIRKVMGASLRNIVSLLAGQFLKLIVIASMIALPLAWYGMDNWLDGFAFRIGLGWDLFVIPVLILAVIALGTVSFQIIRGANTNPAKILRSE